MIKSIKALIVVYIIICNSTIFHHAVQDGRLVSATFCNRKYVALGT